MTLRSLPFTALLAATLFGGAAPALAAHHEAGEKTREVTLGPLKIHGAWARARIGQAPNSAAYMTIMNMGDTEDRLLEAASPAARAVELHEHTSVDGVMRMRPVSGGIVIAGSGKTTLKPGGYHVMLIDLTDDFEAGSSFPLTLTFEQAGTVTLTVPVRSLREGQMDGKTPH